jgi:hypothetical protein
MRTVVRLLPAPSTMTAAFGLIIFLFAPLGMQACATEGGSRVGLVISPQQVCALNSSLYVGEQRLKGRVRVNLTMSRSLAQIFGGVSRRI